MWANFIQRCLYIGDKYSDFFLFAFKSFFDSISLQVFARASDMRGLFFHIEAFNVFFQPRHARLYRWHIC